MLKSETIDSAGVYVGTVQAQQDQTGLRYGSGRDALVQAAVALGGRIGVGRLTHRNIALEAGVAHGLVQHHFGTIGALLEEALEYCLQDTLVLLDAPSERPEDFVSKIMETVRANPEAQVFQYELMLEARRRPELQIHLRRLDAAYRSAVKNSLTTMGLRGEHGLNEAVFAAIDGIVFQFVTVNSESDDRFESSVRGLLGLLVLAKAQQH